MLYDHFLYILCSSGTKNYLVTRLSLMSIYLILLPFALVQLTIDTFLDFPA